MRLRGRRRALTPPPILNRRPDRIHGQRRTVNFGIRQSTDGFANVIVTDLQRFINRFSSNDLSRRGPCGNGWRTAANFEPGIGNDSVAHHDAQPHSIIADWIGHLSDAGRVGYIADMVRMLNEAGQLPFVQWSNQGFDRFVEGRHRPQCFDLFNEDVQYPIYFIRRCVLTE